MNSILPNNPDSWKGYTIEEIRYKRAVNILKMEVVRERIVSHSTRRAVTASDTFYGNLVQRLFKSISMAEYAFLAFKGVRQAQKLFRLFRR